MWGCLGAAWKFGSSLKNIRNHVDVPDSWQSRGCPYGLRSVFPGSDCQLGLSQRDRAGIGGHVVKDSKAENDKCTSLLGSVINGAVTGGILRGNGNLWLWALWPP